MLLSSLLRNWKRSAPEAGRRMETSLRQRAGLASRLEALEGRCLLSTLTVTSLQDSGAGSLRAEIAAAQSGDTIVFDATLFSSTALSGSTTLLSSTTLSRSAKVSGSSKHGHGKPQPPPPPPPPPIVPNTITLSSGELLLTKNLTIQGPATRQLTISGNDASRVLEVAQGAAVTLSGLTISRGFGVTYGGGILNNGTLTVSNSTVFNNGAIYGAGIYNAASGTLTVGDNSTLSGNYADGVAGGAIYNAGGTVTVSNSTVSGNNSKYGGGIYNSGGTLTITNSTLSGNYTFPDYSGIGGYGGAIYNSAGSVTISNSILSGNQAGAFGLTGGGGGIYNAAGGTVTVKNSSTITGNTGSFEGAAEDVVNVGVLYLDSTSTIGILDGNPAF